jgi:hypothetical protein
MGIATVDVGGRLMFILRTLLLVLVVVLGVKGSLAIIFPAIMRVREPFP